MKVEISNLMLKVGLAAMAALLIVAMIFGGIKKYSYDKQLLEMSNTIAARDKTLEISNGMYDKLAIQNRDLESFLTSKDKETVALKVMLEKTKQDLLTANKLVVSWKKAYAGAVAATQTTLPPTTVGGEPRVQVKFAKDWGYVGVEGWTKTNPAESWVSIKQNRPLKIALVVSQDSNKTWHSFATSSEENLGVDIELSAVNPWLTATKWYERVALTTFVGIGKDLGNTGNLTGIFGVGATVAVNQFDFGPFVAFHIGDTADPLVGLQFGWHPWQR